MYYAVVVKPNATRFVQTTGVEINRSYCDHVSDAVQYYCWSGNKTLVCYGHVLFTA